MHYYRLRTLYVHVHYQSGMETKVRIEQSKEVQGTILKKALSVIIIPISQYNR